MSCFLVGCGSALGWRLFCELVSLGLVSGGEVFSRWKYWKRAILYSLKSREEGCTCEVGCAIVSCFAYAVGLGRSSSGVVVCIFYLQDLVERLSCRHLTLQLHPKILGYSSFGPIRVDALDPGDIL